MPNEFGILPKYNSEFLFHSRKLEYKSPFGAVATKETVTIHFPIAETLSVDAVYLIVRGEDYTGRYRLTPTEDGAGAGYRVFSCDFSLHKPANYFYRFEAFCGESIIYIGRGEHGQAIAGEWLPEWQLTVYDRCYKTPEYLKGGLVYHIFVDRFSREGEVPAPPCGVMKDWKEPLTVIDPDGVYRANDFYGGNLRGIIKKLPYLESLGVTMLYLSPIFESHSNHRYDTGDYRKIDPMIGTEEEFLKLIRECEKRDMGVMLDGVFNHTGADSLYFNKFGRYDSLGAYQSKDSPYYDWFTFQEFPDKYTCWWGITVVPTVRRDSVRYQAFIAGEDGVLEQWTRMGVKAWRLDVVDELSSAFVKKIRKKLKEIGQETVLIGEVWEDASNKFSYGEEREYFRGQELDGVMNYLFKDAILAYLCDGDAGQFSERVLTVCENYPKQSLDVCMTLLDSHDTVRAINALAELNNHAWELSDKQKMRVFRLNQYHYSLGKKRLMAAAAIQFFLPGVPSVYYGDEVGLEGFTDPLNRAPFPWDGMDDEILAHYRMLGKLRKENKDAFTAPLTLEVYRSMVKLKRKNLSLIINAKETQTLDRPYYDCITEKEVKGLGHCEFIVVKE